MLALRGAGGMHFVGPHVGSQGKNTGLGTTVVTSVGTCKRASRFQPGVALKWEEAFVMDRQRIPTWRGSTCPEAGRRCGGSVEREAAVLG